MSAPSAKNDCDVYAVVVQSDPPEEVYLTGLSRHVAMALTRAFQDSPDFDGVDLMEGDSRWGKLSDHLEG